MAFDAQKTLLLEKQYLYVRASKGFTLEGTSTERIWTNTGYYRFLVDNVARSIGNSYVTIHYDSSDLDFIAYCSDLFLEEIQNSVTAAVENIESVVEDFAQTNHDDIDTLSTGLSNALQTMSSDLKDGLFHEFGGGSGVRSVLWWIICALTGYKPTESNPYISTTDVAVLSNVLRSNVLTFVAKKNHYFNAVGEKAFGSQNKDNNISGIRGRFVCVDNDGTFSVRISSGGQAKYVLIDADGNITNGTTNMDVVIPCKVGVFEVYGIYQ